MTNNAQAFSLPLRYTNNLQVSYATTTTLTVAAGQARNSANQADITSASLTLDFTVNGANGLDTGSIGASNIYFIYQIGSSLNVKTPASIASLSATTPLLPDGYDVFDLVAIWPTGGSSTLLKGFITGNGSNRKFWYDTSVSVLSAGTSQTLAAVDLSNVVPAIDNTPVNITVVFIPNAADDKVGITSGSSTATTIPIVSGPVAAKKSTDNMDALSTIVTAKPTIQYINSAASGSTTILVNGFSFFV